ncbi:hypothetical protein L1987_11196 [Smallanthus sonchifolius]|uniref:Uncharacterized protein n=1 Tax=Smallanthus sonchifolius TaxID=185202 RepID=A0ACB9JCE0_9ASTR|nr:hypothetical protein L1987_11196 [Smallanthus sonchifolius]
MVVLAGASPGRVECLQCLGFSGCNSGNLINSLYIKQEIFNHSTFKFLGIHYGDQDMFHLVKSEIARAIIPKEFKLVEAFGWAARVYVNSDSACSHGRKEFGLPSQVATFSKASSQMTHVAEIVASQSINLNFSSTVARLSAGPLDMYIDSESQNQELNESLKKREMGIAVMLPKPIFALEFNCLTMEVHPPVVVSEGGTSPTPWNMHFEHCTQNTKMATGLNN